MTLSNLGWSSQSSFYRPAGLETVMKCARYDSSLPGPLSYGQSLALKLEEVILSCIIRLLYIGSPLAVSYPSHALALPTMAARIISIYIDSIDTVFDAWPRPNIRNKIVKAVSPLVAYGDTTSPVLMISRIVLVLATGNHRTPSLIIRCFRHSVCGVSSAKFCLVFAIQTAATFGFCISELRSQDRSLLSTITLAKPNRLLPLCLSYITKHREPSKSLASQVLDLLAIEWNYLLKVINTRIFGVHQKFTFLLTNPGAFIAPPGVFAYFSRVIIAQASLLIGVSGLTVGMR